MLLAECAEAAPQLNLKTAEAMDLWARVALPVAILRQWQNDDEFPLRVNVPIWNIAKYGVCECMGTDSSPPPA